MRFGLFGGGKIGRLNPLGDSHGYRDLIEYIKDADRLGIESLFVVEHHFTGAGQLSASLNLVDDGALIGTPADIIEKLQRLADGGVRYVLLTNAVVTRESLLEFCEEIMPHVSGERASRTVGAVAGA